MAQNVASTASASQTLEEVSQVIEHLAGLQRGKDRIRKDSSGHKRYKALRILISAVSGQASDSIARALTDIQINTKLS